MEPSSPVTDAIELRLRAVDKDLGGFTVGRVLPAIARRMVGPWVFVDHIGPADLAPGKGIDVRPHPHIGLATVTYLWHGGLFHRDSVGSAIEIGPGAINWMTAGRGIAHSERATEASKLHGQHVHGLQLWVGLPDEAEDVDPSFAHHPEHTLPTGQVDGATVRLLAGTAWGMTSPVRTASPLAYADLSMKPGARIAVPADHEERAVYVVAGTLRCDGHTVPTREMIVLRPGTTPLLTADDGPVQAVLLGGAPIGPRYMWWNFVASSPERIHAAAEAWRAGAFAKVPADDVEFIPLPADPPRFARP